MFRFVLLLAFIPALVLGQTAVNPCADGRPPPVNVNVHGCVQPPCTVPQGTYALMDVNFTAPFVAESMTPRVFATVLGLTIEYQLEPAFLNACLFLGTNSCPLTPGQQLTYYFQFNVPSIYPLVQVIVQLALHDHLDRTHFCFLLPIQVVAPLN